MITRYWKGVVKDDMANEYIKHLDEETLKSIQNIKGFLGAEVLQRKLSEGVEFLVLTKWDSLDNIKQFAGEDINNAVVPDVAAAMMIRYDNKVQLFELASKI